MRQFTAILLLLAGVIACVPMAAAADKPTIRIGLDRYFAGSTRLYISCTGPFSLLDNSDNKIIARARPRAVYLIEIAPDHSILVEDTRTASPLPASAHVEDFGFRAHDTDLLEIANAAGTAGNPAMKWHAYRGDVTVRETNSPLLPFSSPTQPTVAAALQVINTVDLEDYLYAVLPAEIGAEAPMEALKAQACASRTFALKNLGRFAAQGFDIDDTSHSQSYAGYDGETLKCREAVDATRGLVLTYHGELIEAPYSTDSGGMTACDTTGECPYLQAVKDAPASGGPEYACDQRFHTWTKTFSASDLAAALAKDARTAVPQFQSLSIDGYDASGRVTTVTVTGVDGTTKCVTGPVFRSILGYDVLRSTLFTVAVDTVDGSYVFSGKGWGHGLGMSQNGAIAMASDPYDKSYKEILQHYYVGVDITSLDKNPSFACSKPSDSEADQRG